MPTYKNNTLYAVAEKGIHFAPGETHKTEYTLSDARLTKLLDTPYYNPTIAIHDLTSTGPDDDKTVTLNASTTEIMIWKIVGATVTVYLNDVDAGVTVSLPEGYEIALNELKGRVIQVILVFSHGGTCEVVEVRG